MWIIAIAAGILPNVNIGIFILFFSSVDDNMYVCISLKALF
jgi:hypothetical protein